MTLALLAGCGDDGSSTDPHDLIDCNRTDVAVTTECERACAEKPATTLTGTCTATNPSDSDPRSCPGQFVSGREFEFDGLIGCCLDAGNTFAFYECE